MTLVKAGMQNQKIKQVWIPYWDWEDWKHGMWRKLPKEQEAEMLERCIEFTGNWVLYGEWMQRVVQEWPLTMLNSLTNPSVNKRAFIGHCACSLAFGCPEYITRMAWKELTDQQRLDADDIAEITYHEWKNNRLHQQMAEQMLPGASRRIA